MRSLSMENMGVESTGVVESGGRAMGAVSAVGKG
jgi:hypothetical protein